MSDYPQHLKYLDTHEYVRLDGDIATIGVTAFAVEQLGDIVFLELPEVNVSVSNKESFGSIESVKAVEDLKSPVTGVVVECNDALMNSPEKIAEDPYGEGWLIKVKMSDLSEINDAMNAADYSAKVEGE
ncbi:Glycine cleavage system H protein [Richelia intracellularis HM01]|uniref:glycine cleavage system protein GcvH n=1 Tax=Richelia intracellularis TaxID=1164990 RepID=UPI0002B55007|nr:glycine cleavage system protein GcvH [Richelia intracellularis]CCH65954.1 Glycine cleavage system H protein [Richelia intracellularis HM01]